MQVLLLRQLIAFVFVLHYITNQFNIIFIMTTIRDFVPVQKLGEGSFSTVYQVSRVSYQKPYALKKVKMNTLNNKERFNSINEVRILASLDSQHIISYKQAFYQQNNGLLCIVMEFAEGGDILKQISQYRLQKKHFPEQIVTKALTHIAKGLQYLHSRNILHRDLKSANIFIKDGNYKIGDLNVSKVTKSNLACTQTGTPYYSSPQIWRDEEYNQKSDIWSLGIVIYQMMALKPPFRGQSMQLLCKSIQKCKYEPLPKCYSKKLHNLVYQCLSKDPKARPSAKQLLSKLIGYKYQSYTNSAKLLQTIQFDPELQNLKNKLPSSNYNSKKSNQILPSFSQLDSHCDDIIKPIRLSLFVKNKKQKIQPEQIATNIIDEICRKRVKSLPKTENKSKPRKIEVQNINNQDLKKNPLQVNQNIQNIIKKQLCVNDKIDKKHLFQILDRNKNACRNHRIESQRQKIMPCWWG